MASSENDFCAARDPHRTRLRIESLAVAIGTVHRGHVFFELTQLHLVASRLVPIQQLRNESVEIRRIRFRFLSASPSKL